MMRKGIDIYVFFFFIPGLVDLKGKAEKEEMI
jgi:hypothetical protein